MTNRRIAERLAAEANGSALEGGGDLYSRVVDDAGDWVDTADLGDWEVSR